MTHVFAALGSCFLYLAIAWMPETVLSAWSPPPIPVSSVTATQEDLPVYLSGLGSVIPVNTVTVRPQVSGKLMKVLFEEGQPVKSGHVLAEIDPRPFQVLLAQSEGQLARDQSLLNNAIADLQRYRDLVAAKSISKQQLDAQAALVQQYRAAINIDKAQIDDAKLQLSHAHVTAPISGHAGLRLIDPGNVVGLESSLVVITQLHPITAVFNIPEDSLPLVAQKLQQGDKLSVEAFDRAQKIKLADGALKAMDNQIDSGTGTIKLKAQFPNSDRRLFPNQFVNIRLRVDTLKNATTIPSAAVYTGSQGPFVYVVKPDNTITLRTIVVGVTEGEKTQVTSGLKPGERVVVNGVDRLKEGTTVALSP